MRLNSKLIIYPIVVALVSSVIISIPQVLFGTPLLTLLTSIGSGGAGGYLASVGVLIVGIGFLWVSGFVIIKVVDFFDATKKVKA